MNRWKNSIECYFCFVCDMDKNQNIVVYNYVC